MKAIPSDILLDNLSGPKRGKEPYQSFKDEISWSPKGSYFVLAYTIAEVSMLNYLGCLAWGSVHDGKTNILGNPQKIYVGWQTDWCIWLNDETFVFKVEHYDGKKTHIPLVVVNIQEGFAVIPNTNNTFSKPSHLSNFVASFMIKNAESLLKAIEVSS